MIRLTAILLFILICLAQPIHAGNTSSMEAIHITSDQMEALDKEGKVIFTGNVVAQKGDLTIYSDKLTVFYDQKKGSKGKKGSDHSLKRLVAQGHVRIVQGQKSAKGAKAVYDKTTEVIVLTGNASVWQDKNMVKGEKITVFLNEDKSIVESAPGKKVEAVVYTHSQ